jgi:hypothetical protein
MNPKLTENLAQDGYEIRFPGPISEAVSAVLTEHGFRFNPDRRNEGKDKRWWAKRTPARMQFALNLVAALSTKVVPIANIPVATPASPVNGPSSVRI